MKATKITGAETAPLKVASLPSRPTAPTAFGGKGYSASEMKAAFDRLPLFIIERLNLLLDDVADGEILSAIPTGISEGHTLTDFLADFTDGGAASYLTVLGTSLTEAIQSLRDSLAASVAGDAELRDLVEAALADIARSAERLDEVDAEMRSKYSSLESKVDESIFNSEEERSTLSSEISEIQTELGDVSLALDKLHEYAVALAGGAV